MTRDRHRIEPSTVRPGNLAAALRQVEGNLRHRRLTRDADVVAAVVAALSVKPSPTPRPVARPVRRAGRAFGVAGLVLAGCVVLSGLIVALSLLAVGAHP